MAKKEEKPVADNETGKIKVKSTKEKQPDGNETKGDVTEVVKKMKQAPKDLSEETVTKIDLNKPPKPEENEVKENNVNDEGVAAESSNAESTQEQKEVQPEAEAQEIPVLEEVTKKEVEDKVEEVATATEEAIKESIETGKPLPENVQKLVDFMEETGGDLNDYVKLNRDYSEMDNHTLLREYYKESKPHLNDEEINFIMEDNFSYDEEADDERDIRRKKLALKEQVADAKNHLDGLKSKYYEDIKAGSKLTEEQQKAIDFFNRYKKEDKESKNKADKQKSNFLKKTNSVFNDKFKGFEYNVGEKDYRFNVKNAEDVKTTQSDINNFVKKFLNEDGEISDAESYHKSLYTAMNADAIAKHFYEQGKSDAMNDSITNAKNIDMSPRQSHGGEVNAGGIKVKVLGDNSSDFKFKIKNNK
tara:strand:+ start:2695 stop:3945 length:1251 start_codon:yes stop_codon:yes gene_type:complete